jgi:hypothetical protein
VPERFRFLVDEAALQPASGSGVDELSEAFERLATLIQDLRSHSIGKFSLIWEEQIGLHPLYKWLFEATLGIDREVATALQFALDRTPDWDSTLDTAGLQTSVSIAGKTQLAFSASAAERETHGGHATGCLSAHPLRRGPLSVAAGDRSTLVHFLYVPADNVAFFRDVPEVEGMDEEAYFENASLAFPQLHFVRDKTQFRHFEERYETIRSKVTAHLAVLNDFAAEILGSDEPADSKQKRFGALGIDASGESPQTKANAEAMKQRKVEVAGSVVVCDWHTKIQRNIDRIYFNATSRDKVVVGIFRDHLD